MPASFKNLMYPQSFLCKEAKIDQNTFSEKKPCEKPVTKQYENSDSHAFRIVIIIQGKIFTKYFNFFVHF